MYGLPADFDPRVFMGRQLTGVVYAEYLVALNFTGDLTVSISGSLPFRTDENEEPRVDVPTVLHTNFMSLVGRSVVGFDLRSPRELVLELDGGGSLTLLDDADMYECYQFSIDGRLIVV